MKKRVVVLAFAAMAAGLAGMGVWCARLNARVHELEEVKSKSEKVRSKGEEAKREGEKVKSESGNAQEGARETVATTNLPPQLAVLGVDYEGKDQIEVRLSERPDMEVVRRFVSVEPMAEGRPSFEYRAKYDYRANEYVPTLIVRGEFAFRTNCVLKIAKGLPLYGNGANPRAEGSLKVDYIHTFRRKDQTPHVAFAADGRYLPPGGKRAIEVESVNVSNILTSVRRVEPRNVVQMLAREERVYGRYQYSSCADGEETEELAGEKVTNVFRCANRPNVKELTRLTVDVQDGKPTNGIYLVSIFNSDLPKCDWAWRSEILNPVRYRVVCLSDLGLSVRKSGTDGLGVWVTSLTTGQPVAGAWIDVYSPANIKVMEGRSDAKGWCVPKRIEKGEAFAVVVIAPDGDDMTFMALRESMQVDETYPDGDRSNYLKTGEYEAFLWTDRGIYRHDENIFLQAILRDKDRRAPKPMPVELVLRNPKGDNVAHKTVLSDAEGTVTWDKFAVAADQPSGVWTLLASGPGRVYGRREIKIEEFAPPQIRVKVEAKASAHPTNFAFTVEAEHLFGGPAHGLKCEGAVVFEDVPFAPAAWKGWHFGNDDLGLRPSYREVGDGKLDRAGKCRFEASLWADSGRPKAAVRVTGQGVVFEDGGRPATMRRSEVLHYYPFYIGSNLSEWMKLEPGLKPSVGLVCVDRAGKVLSAPKKLALKLERIDSVYSYKKSENGWSTWSCERLRVTVADGIAVQTSTSGTTRVELPIAADGDYALTVTDPETGVSFGRSFYLSRWGDNVVRAPLENPTAVTLVPNKAFYRVGESPRLTVKSPFAGHALVTVLREKEVYTEVQALTNATSEIVLRPVTAENAPNLDVYVSVVQGVGANARHLAVRARGQTTVCVRPLADEVPVAIDARVVDLRTVDVTVDAPGAAFARVTVVDEAINLLTGEPTPDPVGYFAEPCQAEHPLFDLYHRILPVVGEDTLKVSGVKTGGGFGAEMLGRVSPTPTRRFKPLALWSDKVAVTNGKAQVTVKLPEFVGEVRVTVVAYGDRTTGAASVQRKVTPKLVMQPDAPRFVAPKDAFDVSLPIYNRSGDEAKFGYEISCGGKMLARAALVRLPKDGSTNIVARVQASSEPGEMDVRYYIRGCGELHEQTIHLPVRPAVAWREVSGFKLLVPGLGAQGMKDMAKAEGWSSYRVFDSPVGELAKAMEWLAEYPHGCLEQTSSRIFPLIAAGGILTAVGSEKATNRAEYVTAGVRRVESMVRENDFVMWPDCNYPPWDREVSLYAAHFLIEAERAGEKLTPSARARVMKFLKGWALATNETVSAYALHTLALAGAADKDRMLSLYDRLDRLSLLDRARLARAFVALGDRPRAEALLKTASAPSTVKEAAFAVLALLEIDPDDARVLPLVAWLNGSRDRQRFCWGTTGENAHALLAMGEYYRHHPPKKGEKFIAWGKLTLPDVSTVTNESNGISIARRFLTPEGKPAELTSLRRGEMLVAELSVSTDVSRELSDLVIEDLFAGALEPVHGNQQAWAMSTNEVAAAVWVMRSDARDDRMLVFSKRFRLEKGQRATFRYPLRVVSSGDYILPGPSVEAMYFPELRSKCAPGRIQVGK